MTRSHIQEMQGSNSKSAMGKVSCYCENAAALIFGGQSVFGPIVLSNPALALIINVP